SKPTSKKGGQGLRLNSSVQRLKIRFATGTGERLNSGPRTADRRCDFPSLRDCSKAWMTNRSPIASNSPICISKLLIRQLDGTSGELFREAILNFAISALRGRGW